jgi:hypothetical protein
MCEGISGPELDCGAAVGTSWMFDRTFGRGVEACGLRTPGDRFVVCGVDGKPPTPLRAGVPFIAPGVELFAEVFRSWVGRAVRCCRRSLNTRAGGAAVGLCSTCSRLSNKTFTLAYATGDGARRGSQPRGQPITARLSRCFGHVLVGPPNTSRACNFALHYSTRTIHQIQQLSLTSY